MSKHKEIAFEDEVVAHLAANGWSIGHPAGYSRELALYRPDLGDWLRETQPQEWAKIEKTHGDQTLHVLAKRLGEVLDKEGSLHVLRQGFKHINAKFEMCAFKPETSLNAATLERFAKVRCTVLRQVHYSRHHENSIDLVFFVNGIPVATAELKTDFTQSIHSIASIARREIPKPMLTSLCCNSKSVPWCILP
jgi:type I restriction enzyme R subunit